MKKQRYFGLYLMTVALVFSACQKDGNEIALPFNEVLEKTSLENEPILVQTLSNLTNVELAGRVESAATPFGELDFSTIVKRIAKQGQERPNYTIEIIHADATESVQEFLTLIYEDEQYWAYIIH